MLNYDKITREKPTQLKPIDVDGIQFSRLYTYHQNSIQFTTVLKVNQQMITGSTTLYPYTLEKLGLMIRQSHLKHQVYGSLNQTPLHESDSHFYIVIRPN